MVNLKIGGVAVDMPLGGAEVALNFAIKNLQDFGNTLGTGSYTIALPYSPANRAIFGSISNLDFDLERSTNSMPATLEASGRLMLEGSAIILSFSKETIEIQFVSGAPAWGALFKDRMLWDVDKDKAGFLYDRWIRHFDICDVAGTRTHTGIADASLSAMPVTYAELRDRFQTNCYPPVSYNKDLFTGNATTALPIAMLRPAAFLSPFLRAHFRQAGFALVSEWLDEMDRGIAVPTDVPHPLILPFVLENWIVSRAFDESLRVRISNPTDGPSYFYTQLPIPRTGHAAAELSTIEIDTFGEVVPQTITEFFSPPYGLDGITVNAWTPTEVGRYSLSGLIKGAVDFAVLITNDLFWHVYGKLNDGTNYATFFTGAFVLTPAIPDLFGSDDFSGEVDITQDMIDAGMFITLEIEISGENPSDSSNFRVRSGTELRVSKVNRAAEGLDFDIRDTVPDIAVIDVVKSLVSMFNLYFYTSLDGKTVYMETRSRFFRELGLELDRHVDYSSDIKQEFAYPSFSEQYSFLYSPDGDDLNVKEYDGPAFGLDMGAYLYALPKFGQEGTKNVEVKSFGPTLNKRYATGLGSFIEALEMRSSTFGVLRTLWKPRIASTVYQKVDPSPSGTPTTRLVVQYTVPPVLCSLTDPDLVHDVVDKVVGFFFYQKPYFTSMEPEAVTENLSFSDMDSAKTGLFSRCYAEEFDGIGTRRQVTLSALVTEGLLIENLTDFRNLVWYKGHIAQLVYVNKYKVGGDNRVEIQLVVLR